MITCARGKAIICCYHRCNHRHKNRCNQNQTVTDTVHETLVRMCYKSLTWARIAVHKYYTMCQVDHAYQPHLWLTMTLYFLFMCTTIT